MSRFPVNCVTEMPLNSAQSAKSVQFRQCETLHSLRPAEGSSRSCAFTCDDFFAAKHERFVDVYESGVWWLAEIGAYHAGLTLIPYELTQTPPELIPYSPTASEVKSDFYCIYPLCCEGSQVIVLSRSLATR